MTIGAFLGVLGWDRGEGGTGFPRITPVMAVAWFGWAVMGPAASFVV
jgi:hypothetical protein